ncbi:ArgP/LysG family DNA-binding transcriptional regulator [Nocardioides alcanivorans]|uniref:ArgP/LysG family DNA-binding transcriptional regulator n=1 Tax=Nocardioides alcanivorans TaxID=2897352 RepID=UPI001F3890F7|nr:ArgP/LysG family DNA-binding transcriptional regulator [Nocardioides alcanivorans]
MRFDPAQLETLVTIAEQGTFEGAARTLQLTPSAVSQRVRALERAAGTVLLQRTTPVGVTRAGEPLLKLGRQLRLLAAEASVELDGRGVVDLPVAVNADSLATWFRPVLAAVAARPGLTLRLYVEDQAHSQALLRRGDVVAAITDDPEPVQGCVVTRLGEQRYSPVATPDLVARHRRGTGMDWEALPMVVFNEVDRLQDRVLEQRGTARPPVVHRVPTSADFLAAVEAGLGWGMLPEGQLEASLRSGRVELLPGAESLTVTLHWQRWRLSSDALDELSADVRRAATRLHR